VTSTFGWLDTDESRRDAMLKIVELFKDESTVDDLGIGSIRDAISDALFPGTSVLHTRLRYILFVPWLLAQAAQAKNLEAMRAEFRRLEIRLIYSLLIGGETEGVIGGVAKDALKRTPSAAYWASLRRYGTRTWNTSVDGFFRRTMTQKTLRRHSAEPDDPEAREALEAGLDPNLPEPPPDLLHSATFALPDHERRYLVDRLSMSTEGSLLAWLVHHPRTEEAAFVWELGPSTLPPELENVVEQGRLFREVIRGAPLLYNLILSERARNSELEGNYRQELATWREQVTDGPLRQWDGPHFWRTLQRAGSPIRQPTQIFVDAWVQHVDSTIDLASSDSARTTIADRERRLKGGRSRLVNQAALDRWNGAAGLVTLDYRWRVTRGLLLDLWETT